MSVRLPPSVSTTRAAPAQLTRAAAPSAAVTAPPAGLRKGDTGPKVKQLQDALVKLGYMTKAQVATGPGTFGPKTEAAVKKFQGDKKLPTTGYYGELTHAALKKALSSGGKPPVDGPTKPPPTNGGKFTKPPVISAPSPNYNERGGKDIDSIVLHHTASNNGAGDLAWMRNPKSQVSAHYMVDRDGKIYQLVNDQKRAWHAGNSALHGVPTDMNSRSIGIEIVNAGDGKTPFTEAQYKALTQLTGYLKQQYDVPMKNIVGHADVAVPKGRKNDPAPNFDWNRLRKGIS
ncbi:N-acetylmuramoyl-L-alanine amidase [Pyxidicoccus fallax]|uniref:N-acetylmuramoyl-L-alanine amidase n=1 Tax=Pyxidicoccus fallax TaxID=394095 RepID=A0A848LNS3_9BACT|nr:N-acetylmuramoyl-L-alanine amidase [Pyxidicoccus fallax]NMO19194.1 N-acetylmuramoyl-L-alanine amidase [Pyxidicoccus fallax]NPC80215.1 N-acetylmuramoyl-L-alanine amidase [Pyxidicoccus fallax]